MDEAMQRVETNLGTISERCNSRMLEKHARNYKSWDGTLRGQGMFVTDIYWT